MTKYMGEVFNYTREHLKHIKELIKINRVRERDTSKFLGWLL